MFPNEKAGTHDLLLEDRAGLEWGERKGIQESFGRGTASIRI